MNIMLSGQAVTLRYRLLLAAHFKLFVIILIFLLSWYSGAAQAYNSIPAESVFVKQTADVTLSSQRIQYAQVDFSQQVSQVAVVQIVKKQGVRPTNTPKPTQAKAESKQEDKKDSSAQQIITQSGNPYLDALNAYRQKNGKTPLQWDGKLAQYAQERAELYIRQGGLDHHTGFNDYIHNQDGFKKLGYYSLGENSGYNHSSDPASIIENSYGKSPSHNENQLSGNWSHVGIGVSGSSTNFIFGGSRM